MQTALDTPHDARRLGAYVLVGLAVGALYAVANAALDAARANGLVDTLATVHHFVDQGIPLIAGALAGVAANYLHLRARLARAEVRRADEMAARLRELERDQAVWIVAAATLHEVKNPVHALGLLLDEIEAAPDANARVDYLGRARAQVARVADRLAALRGIADAARPLVAEVRLESIVRGVVEDARPLARREGIDLRMRAEGDVLAVADPSYVQIVLENLVRNAIDARGRRIDIEVRSGAGDALVLVHDDGEGVPADATLFEPLASKKPRGLGLGLPIARALARAMRGDVAVAPSPGWTTTFALRLPTQITGHVA